MADWAIQSVQLVWFGSGSDGIQSDALYKAAFGLEAETVQRNRVPGPANPFWGTASGMLSSGPRAEVQVQPGRIDVVFMPGGNELAPTIPIEFLSTIQPAAVALGDIGPAVRIAIVADLVRMSDSAEAATTHAQQLAMFPQPVNGVTDFSVQMNLRMPFPSLEDVPMNRLLRWATATFQILRFQVPEASQGITPITELSHATSVRMDLNSVPSGRLLDTQQQVAIYADMNDEIARLATNPTLTRLLTNDA